MSKVLLVQPEAFSNFKGMPMGLIHTATALESEHDVTALDLASTPMRDKDFTRFLEKTNPQHVLIGGTSPSHPEAYTLARLVKEQNSKTTVIKGGPHEDFCAEQTAKNQDIDFVVRGNGEATFELLRNIETGFVLSGKIFSRTVDLGKTQLPNRMLLYPKNPEYYNFLDGLPTAQTRTDRGCAFRCTYCSQGVQLKKYSDEHVIEDLEQIAKQGFKAIYFDNALFTMDRKRLERLLPEIARYNFRMGCITRAGINTHEEMTEKRAQAGFVYDSFALESGSERI